jgi:signal transduction histidine kinase
MRGAFGLNRLRLVSTQLIPGLREAHWVALDWLVAALLLVPSVGGVLGRTPEFDVPMALTVAAAALAALPLAVRRWFPVPVLAVVLSANTIVAAAGVAGDPAVTVGLALYTVVVVGSARRALLALGVALLVTIGAEVVSLIGWYLMDWRSAANLISASVLVLVASWATGAAMRAQRRYTARTVEQLAHRAVAEERLRIARELHDVISHGMSLITAKAAVTNYLIDEQPDQARAALTVIEETGRRALVEMRQLLGVLRSDGETPELRPPPGPADLPALAAEVARAGVEVDLDVDVVELPAAVGASVYRIVQEALTNVVKHAAPARCTVSVGIDGDSLRLDVHNDVRHARPPSPPGHGIIGMRERVAAFGGTLAAGGTDGGGFRVTARLPISPGKAR